MNIETLCNEALDAIGYHRHIGNIYEGTPAANIALNAWETLRDGLLNDLEPDWARFDTKITLLKSAPNITGSFADYGGVWTNSYPPLPWLYEFLAPDDLIKPILLKPIPMIVPYMRPRPVPYHLRNEETEQTILCNIPEPVLIYIRRVLNPDSWTEDFQIAMITGLAKQFQTQLAPQAPRGGRREQQNADAAG